MAVKQADSPEALEAAPEQTPWISHRTTIAAGIVVALLLILWATRIEQPRPSPINTDAMSLGAQDQLDFGMNALEAAPEIGIDQAANRGIAYLNAWIARKDNKPAAWKRDPMLDRLPKIFRDPDFKDPAAMCGLDKLEQPAFSLGDFGYLRECLWMRDIARRIGSEASPESLKPWLDEIQQSQGEDVARKLATAERLFDWSVRNVQLDKLLPPPPEPEAVVGDSPDARFRRLPAAAKAIAGPGYKFPPWQAVLFGTGDAWERDRVFIQLCRQSGIEVVMLAIDGDGRGGLAPWLPAAMIGGQLYLFDGTLGLPIPGPDGQGIATLEQVLADPALIRKLDIGDDEPYRISNDDLKKVVALIDAPPESLSQRMATLQKGVKGERRLHVSVVPSDIAAELKSHKGINFVAIWRIPFDAAMYTPAFTAIAQRDPARYLEMEMQYGIFNEQDPIMRGRNSHLRGEYNSDDGSRPAAREWYSQARPPDEYILRIAADEQIQHGILSEMARRRQPWPEDKQQLQQMFQRYTSLAFRKKQTASYFLGLIALDVADYPLAAEWFKVRILEGDPNSPWHPAARYNLGRALEAQGKWREAVDVYQGDTSPQRHGNLLRARQLIAEHQK